MAEIEKKGGTYTKTTPSKGGRSGDSAQREEKRGLATWQKEKT